MAHLYFHRQMLADLEMKIEINPSSPIFGETNCRQTRGEDAEKQTVRSTVHHHTNTV
jgi:hypothetical protein